DPQMLAWRPVNPVHGKCVANRIWRVCIVDGDVGPILEFSHNWILDETPLYRQGILIRAPYPGPGEIGSLCQSNLPQGDGNLLGVSAAIQRIPPLANLVGKE